MCQMVEGASAALDAVALSSSPTSNNIITATNGAVSIAWTFGVLQLVNQSPVVAGKQEIDLVSNYVSRMTGSTRELVLTIDSTA